jgi:pilus assembly protein CpaB
MASIGQVRPGAPVTNVRNPNARNIRTPLFILGIALALVAFLVMFTFGLLFANKAGGAAQTQVVVASKPIDARTPITPDMLTTKSVAVSGVPPGAFTRLSDVTGFAAVVSIPAGQVISPNLVTSNPDQLIQTTTTSYLPIPEGWVAMTLPTSEQQGVAGYIAQGDYINVIATVNTQLFTLANPRMVTRTVFTNVHVIRVGPQTALPKSGQAQGVASSVTVLLTLCDAQYLDWLAVNGQLKYALLSYKDYHTNTPQPDVSCPATSAPDVVGPRQVQARWDFLKG